MSVNRIISYYITVRLNENGCLDSDYFERVTYSDRQKYYRIVKLCHEMEEDDRFSEVLDLFRISGVNETGFIQVLDQLLHGEMNWARVLSIVTLSGALAVHCKENGEEEKIQDIRDWGNSFLDENLKVWIENNGGAVILFLLLTTTYLMMKSS